MVEGFAVQRIADFLDDLAIRDEVSEIEKDLAVVIAEHEPGALGHLERLLSLSKLFRVG